MHIQTPRNDCGEECRKIASPTRLRENALAPASRTCLKVQAFLIVFQRVLSRHAGLVAPCSPALAYLPKRFGAALKPVRSVAWRSDQTGSSHAHVAVARLRRIFRVSKPRSIACGVIQETIRPASHFGASRA